MARQWSARCYGVARQREGSRQTASGAPACFLSGIFRAGSLYPLARGCRRIWRGEGWFRPARCCSTGSGRLDLDLLISGPRVTLVYQPYSREGADGQAVVCPLLRGSSPTRGVAPKQENKAIADQSPLLKLSLRSCLLYTSDAADEEDSVDLG